MMCVIRDFVLVSPALRSSIFYRTQCSNVATELQKLLFNYYSHPLYNFLDLAHLIVKKLIRR